jgi:HAD superfamily hydrolase (TIGR01509 family)
MAAMNLLMDADYHLQYAPVSIIQPALGRPLTVQTPWQLAIFDCDGVLVDSEAITHQVLAAALGELGLTVSLDEAFTLFMGNSLPQTVEIIERRLGRRLPEGFFPAWREQLYAAFREAPVRAVPGVEAVLDALTIPVCVVSNGPLRKMRTTLGVTGLLPRFENRLFSPDSGLPGKPAPDLFLAAAQAFDVGPDEVIVVEDSPTGVRGAVAAGMTVFGYAGAEHTDAAALAAAGARVFGDMRELPALLAAPLER